MIRLCLLLLGISYVCSFSPSFRTNLGRNLGVTSHLYSDKGTFGERQAAAKKAAQVLREEATRLEDKLRAEGGMPEPLVPPPAMVIEKPAIEIVREKRSETIPKNEIRQSLGYLSIGDAPRFSRELNEVPLPLLWNTWDFSTRYSISNTEFVSKTKIQPVSLSLDDVGFDYQGVFLKTLAVASVLGISSSFIPADYGPVGFLLGYGSALLPIGVVGIGSIAPELIGDILKKVKYARDPIAKDKSVYNQAAKLLVGYVAGLPISSYRDGNVEFFQVQPKSASEKENNNESSSGGISQGDISRISAACLAGAVAECMEHEKAEEGNSQDIALLYECMAAVNKPPLNPSQRQDHIRYAAIEAFKILSEYPKELEKLKIAIENNESLEECISAIEGN